MRHNLSWGVLWKQPDEDREKRGALCQGHRRRRGVGMLQHQCPIQSQTRRSVAAVEMHTDSPSPLPRGAEVGSNRSGQDAGERQGAGNPAGTGLGSEEILSGVTSPEARGCRVGFVHGPALVPGNPEWSSSTPGV